MSRFLAEGHSYMIPLIEMNMAFGQTRRYVLNSWGDAPGYGENGLRPKEIELKRVTSKRADPVVTGPAAWRECTDYRD